ncbi:valine--tRNA ligase, mitochondrial [Cephus cinctus]|uniref:valine--tRNA ligase n=1 Tax=Cephus cinctus TaxID=211228 RepID=A0AAJ7BH94_CEPCN|nr:valine--tRNA ligase, mitochondrial [Cephus cinctus]
MNVNKFNDLMRNNYLYKYCSTYCTQRLADIPLGFKPKEFEEGWYETWEKNKYFLPKDNEREPFKIILPPPNITGILHLGHALTATVEDVLARWHRMKNDPVIWIPGLDHAGIATQAVVEKYLQRSRGMTRHDLGREKFVSLVSEWKTEKGNIINSQLKVLGASVDWSREFFTMSENHANAVTQAFVTLNDRNLLYRDKDMINWSPNLHSAVSDIEVEVMSIAGKIDIEVPGYKKKVTFGQIVEFAYKLRDSDEEIIVATTRPETIPGDVAVAVHPDDARYSRYIGSHLWHPFRKTFIPVIGHTSVSIEFGTGAVKITPAHDRKDYAIAREHNLEIIDVIDEDGKITANTKSFEGLPKYIAREKILVALSEMGALKSIKDHEMSIPLCSRSGDVIEYLLREQWFVNCKSMAERALQVVKDGSLKIDPSFHEQTWYDWLGNIRNWCVSRQLWWGHRIPAYHCTSGSDSGWIVAKSIADANILAQKKYGNNFNLKQDNDVLDTWFSSALLPFSSMGWPNQTQDLKKYYPLTLMETGHDILFFWVARMVMLGLELTDQLPFKEVLLHGVLCDGQGKKMSKSRGNVISPESVINGVTLEELNEQARQSFEAGLLSKTELKRTLTVNRKMFPDGIPECGTDALRLTLCSHNLKSRQINFNVIECYSNKLFCNKILQASRYVLRMTNDDPIGMPKTFSTIDRWILSRLSLMVSAVNDAFTERHFYKAVAMLREFFYYEFCDFYLEATKLGFKSEEDDLVISHRYTLIKCLEVSLRAIAPIVPYLSDNLYTKLSKKFPSFLTVPSLLEAPYPKQEEFLHLRDIPLEKQMDKVWKVVIELRSLLAGVNKEFKPEVHLVSSVHDDCNLYDDNLNAIMRLGKIQNIKVIPESGYTKKDGSICATVGTNCYLFLLFDDDKITAQIRNRIDKKIQQTEKKLNDLITLTAKKGYIANTSDFEKEKNVEKISSLQLEFDKWKRML